jgi:hypothetical protein
VLRTHANHLLVFVLQLGFCWRLSSTKSAGRGRCHSAGGGTHCDSPAVVATADSTATVAQRLI